MQLDWFGIQVKPRYEFRASEELGQRGFEVFLPLRKIRRRWSDRIKELEEPVFPTYLFCRFHSKQRAHILTAPSVTQVIGTGRNPTPVSEGEIDAVKKMVASRLALSPWPYLRTGQRVSITTGPLAGLQGIVAKAEDGKPRIVVSVSLLQRSLAAEIERDWIEL